MNKFITPQLLHTTAFAAQNTRDRCDLLDLHAITEYEPR